MPCKELGFTKLKTFSAKFNSIQNYFNNDIKIFEKEMRCLVFAGMA